MLIKDIPFPKVRQAAIDNGAHIGITMDDELVGAFEWHNTPEGPYFWARIVTSRWYIAADLCPHLFTEEEPEIDYKAALEYLFKQDMIADAAYTEGDVSDLLQSMMEADKPKKYKIGFISVNGAKGYYFGSVPSQKGDTYRMSTVNIMSCEEVTDNE